MPLSLFQLAILVSATLIALVAAAAPDLNPTKNSGRPDQRPPPPPSTPRLKCKCQPNQRCWPTPSTWATFNATVSGRLIATTPVARPCYRPSYNATACAAVQQGYHYETWRQQQPGAFQYTNWELGPNGQGCLLNRSSTGSCDQGAVPVYTVKAATVDDVQATVRFAHQHNLKLVVKNTGHDLLGRSTAVGSLSLWVFFMKKIQVIDAFVPEGAPIPSGENTTTKGVGAVVLEAGVVWVDAYKAVDEHNRTVSGGGAETVGTSGGFCQSGGHGPLSPSLGLCVDNVLQYKVVTADGELRVVNAYQHADLFWAMRGGGPGFGVVVEAVYRTHPAVTMSYFQVMVGSEDRSLLAKVLRELYARQIEWSNAGWAGYVTVNRKYVALAYMRPNSDAAGARKTFGPLVTYARGLGNLTLEQEIYSDFPSYYALFLNMTSLVPEINAGFGSTLGSRLIPRTIFETEQGVDKLANTMLQVQDESPPSTDRYAIVSVAGGAVARGSSKETSLHPAWRKALVLVLVVGGWEESLSWKDQLKLQRTLTKATDKLRAITPGSGTYLNEADPNEPNFKQSFYGPNYKTLKGIKNKYDPKGLFVCRLCVGSDDWNRDEMCPRHH
ncbi:hypothetical protein DFQ26_007685 [Actinomortierella ambigua]|nr:hypothetical protein DFQ26_007685 [Actinomortierella ambigua]